MELPADFLSVGRGSVRMDSTLGAGASGVNCVAGMIYTWFWRRLLVVGRLWVGQWH